MAAVSAGISVVSGVAGLVSKNKQASAQRQQLSIEQQRNYDSTVIAMRRMENQQMHAEREYILNDIQFRQGAAQQELALQTQGVLGFIEAQRARNAIEQQLLASNINQSRQQDGVARQRANVVGGASSQRQQSDVQTAQALEQLQANSTQLGQQLSEEDRKQLIARTLLESRSSTGRVLESGNRLRTLAAALTAGLEVDRNAVEAQLQNMSERDINRLTEQLSLGDLSQAESALNSNQRMLEIGADAQRRATDFNEQQQNEALRIAGDQLKFSTEYRNLTESQARQAQREDYTLAQESLSKTGNANAASLQVQQRSSGGASLIDALAVGVGAYNAISPLIKTTPRESAPIGPSSYIPQRYLPRLQSGEFANNSGVG